MPTVACPKDMVHGPCGGVAADGRCEVAEHWCVFVDLPTVRWRSDAAMSPGGPDAVLHLARIPVTASSPSERTRTRLRAGRVVVADFPARALDAASIAECVGVLAGHVDAVLAGDSGRARVQFSPTYRAHLIRSAGLDVWAGVNCRDRNRVALEGELAGLADIGAAAVHCVTGDHTVIGSRPDAKPVFDLDSTELTAAARAVGHLVSVAESPLAPPTDRRVARLQQKVRAGAEVCFVNHAGGVAPVARFVTEARSIGIAAAFIPCIPVVVDRGSAELILSFTSLVLPDGYLDRILAAADVRRAGIAAALELDLRFLEVEGVSGVNLSGGGAVGGEHAFADALAAIGDGIAA